MGRLRTNDGELVTYCDAKLRNGTLTGIALGTPSGIAAVDVQTVRAIVDVDVAISIVGNLIDGSRYHVVGVLAVFHRQELGDRDGVNLDVTFSLCIRHLGCTLVLSAFADESHNITYYQAAALEGTLLTDTIDVNLA